MNPELRRNLWLEITTHRMVAMPAVIALVAALSIAVSGDWPAALSTVAAIGFVVVAAAWGTSCAANSVTEETRAHTWDLQRMSAIGPWSMAWGKLVGATAFAWYGGGLCLVIYLVAGMQRGAETPPLQMAALMIASSILFQSAALSASLIAVQKGTQSRGIGTMMGLAVLSLVGLSSGMVAGSNHAISWWGEQRAPIDFLLGSCVVYGAWSVFGTYRSMCTELRVRSLPWALAAFVCFSAVYVAGFGAPEDMNAWAVAESIGAAGLLVSMVAGYVLLFAEHTGASAVQRLRLRIGRRQWRSMLEELPGWPVAFALALAFALITAMIAAGGGGESILRKASAAPIGIALFGIRDAAICQFFAFSRQPRRVESTTLIYLGLLYWIIPWLLRSLDLERVASLVLPPVLSEPVSGAMVMSLQAAVALALAYWRWRRNFGI